MDTISQLENIEKAFYNDGYQLGIEATAGNEEKQINHNSIKKMYAAIETLIESLFSYAQQKGQKIDCKTGCAWCCHQPVFALDYELDYLKSFITDCFDEETIREIHQKAILKQKKTGMLSGDELLNSKYPCPLLNDNACMAYEARPMACRIYLSTDVNTCEYFYNEPDDKTSYPALLDIPMRLGRMMNEGFKSALKTKGIEAKEHLIINLMD